MAIATVLVVDDDAMNIAILARLLEPEFDVVFATSGKQALELIARVLPDLVLLDVMMPDMDGYTVCTQLKADPLTAGIPIIFVTGIQETDSESYGLELGAADYITKPFNPNVVRARVRNHVELKRARDRLLALASSDGLTGLANRRAFDTALEFECKRLARTSAPLGLILLDIDYFKPFNDLYGHVAGDECLRRVADQISGAMARAGDLAARYGGEEFACILPDTGLDGTVAIAERIKMKINAMAISHAGSKVATSLTASFGAVSTVCGEGTGVEAILRSADACLYRAKVDGRNRVIAADGFGQEEPDRDGRRISQTRQGSFSDLHSWSG